MSHRLNAANNGVTTLSADMTAGDTSCTVTDGSVLPSAPARIVIEAEIIEYGGKSGNSLTSLTRGAEGTSAVAHYTNDAVENRFTKGYYDELAAGADLTTHVGLSNPHNATAAATADRIVLRDAAGRAAVAAPSATTDIALLSTVNTAAQACRIRSYLGV